MLTMLQNLKCDDSHFEFCNMASANIQNANNIKFFSEHGSSHGHTHGGVPPPSNVRHLTEIVNSNADMALGHNTTDTEETDEMVKTDKTPNKNKPAPHRPTDPGHMNMKGVFLHVLSDALGEFFFLLELSHYWKVPLLLFCAVITQYLILLFVTPSSTRSVDEVGNHSRYVRK